MFSYELQRLEMADSLNKIELFFVSVVKFQTIKAALLHEVMRILGLLCLVALPSKILMVLDVHHHGVNIAVSGKGKDSISSLCSQALEVGYSWLIPHQTQSQTKSIKRAAKCSPHSADPFV